MRRIRVIPVLTVLDRKLVKTVRFKKPNYIGDPINAVRLYNDKEVDEISILDISKSRFTKGPNIELATELAGECFMPLGFGGGIQTFDHAKALFDVGIEKVIINSAFANDPKLITKIADNYGAQAVVLSLDVKTNLFGTQKAAFKSASVLRESPKDVAMNAERAGAGEILLNNVSREGTFSGYDLALIQSVSQAVSIPVVACGGARGVEDFEAAISKGGASAVAGSSLFVYRGNDPRSILINYPAQSELKDKLYVRGSGLNSA